MEQAKLMPGITEEDTMPEQPQNLVRVSPTREKYPPGIFWEHKLQRLCGCAQ